MVVPALVAVDTVLAYGRGWRFRSRLETAVFILLMIVMVVAPALYAIPRTRRVLGRFGTRLVLLVGAFVTSVALIEIALHLCCGWMLAAQLNLRPPNRDFTFRPRASIMPGIEGVSHFRTNSMGVRGEEWPSRNDAYRILCIGGSATECAYLDDLETWPYLLGKSLQSNGRKVWVGNAGISGASTIEHLYLIDSCEVFRDIDCAVFMVGLNDFQNYLAGILLDRTASPLWRQTAVWSVTMQAYTRLRLERGMIEDAEGRVYETRRQKRREAKIVDELPDLTQPLRAYQGRIERIVAICRQQGVRPIFVTQPIVWDVGLSPAMQELLLLGISNRPDGAYYSIAKLREGEDRYNALLLETCKSLGVECIDAGSMNGKEQFYYDDCHFNEAGARRMAEIVAEHFAKRPTK